MRLLEFVSQLNCEPVFNIIHQYEINGYSGTFYVWSPKMYFRVNGYAISIIFHFIPPTFEGFK